MTISYEDFQKLDLRIGRIQRAEKIQGATKLLKLDVSLGEEQRQLVAGIAERYDPETLPGKQIVVLANLEPKMLKGVESQGMILAADNSGKPVILQPEQDVPEGSKVK